MLPDCDRGRACASAAGHWWDCITGRRASRLDTFTATVDAAIGHAATHRERFNDYPPFEQDEAVA